MGHYRNYSRSKMQSATFWPAVMQDAKRCPTGWLMVNVLDTSFCVVQSLGQNLGIATSLLIKSQSQSTSAQACFWKCRHWREKNCRDFLDTHWKGLVAKTRQWISVYANEQFRPFPFWSSDINNTYTILILESQHPAQMGQIDPVEYPRRGLWMNVGNGME